MHTPSTPNVQNGRKWTWLPSHGAQLAVLFATLLGGFVRIAPGLASDFPLNDGGLFYILIRDLQAGSYHLPAFTSYNQASIPFIYPPLSFYLTGFLSDVTGLSILDLLRLLPPLVSIATIPAVYLLARRLLQSRTAASIATVSFALLPTAFDFMIVGGGLPRALGFLFAILTLHQAAALDSGAGKARLASTTILASLTVLCHPVVAWFTFYSLAVLLLFKARNRRGLTVSAIVVVGTIVMTAPWWGTNIARHGVGPFLAAFQAGTRPWSAILAPFLFMQTNEPYLTLQAVFALLGVFLCLRRREFHLPVWLAAVFYLESRLTATYAVIPTALLVGIGFEGIVLRGLQGAGSALSVGGRSGPASIPERDGAARASLVTGAAGRVGMIASAYFIIYLLIAAYLAAPRQALPQSQRQAMQWSRENTPATSRFAVISGIESAGIDYVSEWFPALTDRVSVATPQGYEWFPDQVFDARWAAHGELQRCQWQGIECLVAWASESRTTFTHLYVVKQQVTGIAEGTGGGLYEALRASPSYLAIYDQKDAAIFAYRPGAPDTP